MTEIALNNNHVAMTLPTQGLVYNIPENVQVWFNVNISNPVITTAISTTAIDPNYIYIEEKTMGKYDQYDYNASEWPYKLTNTFYVLNFKYYFTDVPWGLVTVAYDYINPASDDITTFITKLIAEGRTDAQVIARIVEEGYNETDVTEWVADINAGRTPTITSTGAYNFYLYNRKVGNKLT